MPTVAQPVTGRLRVRQGVERHTLFIESGEAALFCSVHAPTDGAVANLVMCPPLLADHPFSYRWELTMADELARRGVCVWRFHYAGTGYSEGEAAPASFDRLVADAQAVVAAAQTACLAPVSVGGTRCGALVAAAAAGGLPLVLWEPIEVGAAYLKEGFRARMIVDAGQLGRRPSTTEQLLAELRCAGRVDLLGYSLHETMYDSLARLRLSRLIAPATERALAIRSQAEGTCSPLRCGGVAIDEATVGVSEGWWFHRTQQSRSAAIGAELAETIGAWLPRGRRAAVELPAPRPSPACEFIPVAGTQVFARLTSPSGPANGLGALLLWGGGRMPGFGRNRVAGVLARRLAARGFRVLQVDYPGSGESPGPDAVEPIDEAAKERLFETARQAYRRLERESPRGVVAVGSCQGAVAALYGAGTARQLAGLALLAPAVDEGCGGDAMSPRFRRELESVASSPVPLLLAYGRDDEGFPVFQGALDAELGGVVRKAGLGATVVLSEERIHGFLTVSGQEATTDLVLRWLAGSVA